MTVLLTGDGPQLSARTGIRGHTRNSANPTDRLSASRAHSGLVAGRAIELESALALQEHAESLPRPILILVGRSKVKVVAESWFC
jgi:hypothetical protein